MADFDEHIRLASARACLMSLCAIQGSQSVCSKVSAAVPPHKSTHRTWIYSLLGEASHAQRSKGDLHHHDNYSHIGPSRRARTNRILRNQHWKPRSELWGRAANKSGNIRRHCFLDG